MKKYTTRNSENPIYDRLYNGLENHSERIMLPYHLSKEQIEKVVSTASNDPWIFYVNTYECLYSPVCTLVYPDYIFSKQEILDLKSEINRNVSIIAKNSGNGTDYQKALMVHDILCSNVKYADDGDMCRHTIVGPIIERGSVCDGYSKAYKLILDTLGIPCLIVNGTGLSGDSKMETPHSWNLVRLNGDWRHVDVTYDVRKRWKDDHWHDYFALSTDRILRDHNYDADMYPNANGPSIDYFVKNGLVMNNTETFRSYILDRIKAGDIVFSIRLPDTVPSDVGESKIKEIINSIKFRDRKKYSINIISNRKQGVFHFKISET